MLDLPSISPISLFGSSGISALAFQPLTATRSASASSLLDIARNTVEVSSGGRLLLAVALFQDELESLPGRTPDIPDGNPIDLTATAQGFVETFNTLLGAVDTLPAGFSVLPGSALADQLVQAANEFALQDIGIEFLPAAIPEIAGAGFRLRLDQNVLDSALADDAAATEVRLTGAIESLRDLTTGFVAQVAGDNVTQDVVSTTLLALNNALVSVATIETTADVNSASATTGNVSPLAITVVADTGRAAEASAIALAAAAGTGQIRLSVNPVGTALPAVPGIAMATTPELDTFEASLALQRLLLDPTFHVTSNLINPAYAALIAASHLSDFVSPIPVINPDAIAADVPAPVSPIAMAHAIAYYSEAAGERSGRVMSRA